MLIRVHGPMNTSLPDIFIASYQIISIWHCYRRFRRSCFEENETISKQKERKWKYLKFLLLFSPLPPCLSLKTDWKFQISDRREKEILYWFSLIARGIWICYKQKCEVSDIDRRSQPAWIVHLFFLENVQCPSHCLELKGERSLNPWPGRLNPSITQNRKSRGIWSRSLRLSLTKKGGTAHLNQASLRNLCK